MAILVFIGKHGYLASPFSIRRKNIDLQQPFFETKTPDVITTNPMTNNLEDGMDENLAFLADNKEGKYQTASYPA